MEAEIKRAMADTLLQCLSTSLNAANNAVIMTPVRDDEVQMVVFSMGAYKAPGPDGFPPDFFQEFWDIFGTDVTLATKDFFRVGKLLKKLNFTYIALIPKF